MPHYGTLQDFSFGKDIDDIRGTTLYGVSDEKLGKVEDVIFDHSTGEIKYAVVDTGGWFTHKEFLVPANRIHAYEKDKDAFQIDMMKEHIERKFPKYDRNAMKSEADWLTYEREYKRAWESDPLQHQDNRLDLDVTPANVQETVVSGPGPGVAMGSLGEEVQEPNPDFSRDTSFEPESFTPERIAGKFPEAVETPGKIQMVPAPESGTTIETPTNEYPLDVNPPANPTQQTRKVEVETGQWHPRMKRFEEVLKQNRVDVTASCASCQPAKDKAA